MRIIFLLFLMGFASQQFSFAQSYRLISANEFDGAASSQNLLKNSGWEKNTANWTASGGTYARSTSSPIRGIGSATWDSNGAAQNLTSSAFAIPAGLYGVNGVVSCRIVAASGSATHTINAYDGTNVLASSTLVSVTSGSARTSVNFVFPSSGSIYLRFLSVASDEPSIKIDDCYLGAADTFNVSQVSQATLYGKISVAGASSCSWQLSSPSTSYTSFPADTDCGTYTATGAASAPGTKIPGVVFSSLPAGKYFFRVQTGDYMGNDATSETDNGGTFRLYDGTNVVGWKVLRCIAASFCSDNEMTGEFEYTTTQTNVTFQLQFAKGTNSTTAFISNPASSRFEISVYRFPTSSETAYRADLSAWNFAGYFTTMPTLRTSTGTTTYTVPNVAAMTLTAEPGSQSCTITTDTNPSMGMTCVMPRAGTVEVCMDYSIETDNGVGGRINDYARWIVGPNASPTITGIGLILFTNDNTFLLGNDGYKCQQFNLSAAGSTDFRFQVESNVVSTNADNHYFNHARASIRYVDQQTPAPLLVNSVTSNSSGLERIERAGVNCDASSQIYSQSGSWLSIGNRSGGCVVTIASGIFSSAPTCTLTLDAGSTSGYPLLSTSSSTSLSIFKRKQDDSAYQDFDGHLICMGPR